MNVRCASRECSGCRIVVVCVRCGARDENGWTTLSALVIRCGCKIDEKIHMYQNLLGIGR